MKNSKKPSKNKSTKTDDPLAGDLSSLLEKGDWKPIRFELKPKNKTVTIRMSEDLLNAVKEKAEENGIDYQKVIREAIEKYLDEAA
jgi:predicted DNA binding CopG/RHH family protein